MKKLLFILNPAAGKKKAPRQLDRILSEFANAGYDVTVHETTAPGDCTQVVRQLAEKMDLVVCCGGDGTFNETVTGILQSGIDVPVGYIPAGSTNDFARSLHLETDFVKAARRIAEGECHDYDIGILGQRHFTYVASFGAFTRTSYATSQKLKNLLGHSAYVLAGARELWRIKPIHMQVQADQVEVEGDFIFGAVCNSTSVAGVLTLDPARVNLSDGQFEVLLVRKPKNLRQLFKAVRALLKQTYDSPLITFCSAKHVQMTAETELPWSLDGEREDTGTQIEICNLHRAIRLVK